MSEVATNKVVLTRRRKIEVPQPLEVKNAEPELEVKDVPEPAEVKNTPELEVVQIPEFNDTPKRRDVSALTAKTEELPVKVKTVVPATKVCVFIVSQKHKRPWEESGQEWDIKCETFNLSDAKNCKEYVSQNISVVNGLDRVSQTSNDASKNAINSWIASELEKAHNAGDEAFSMTHIYTHNGHLRNVRLTYM